MSTLFVGLITKDEVRVPVAEELLPILRTQGKFEDLVDLISEGMDPKQAAKQLGSEKGRAELLDCARASYAELFGGDLDEDFALIRSARLDENQSANHFNLRTAWLMGVLLLPPKEGLPTRCMRIELGGVHPDATLPGLEKPMSCQLFARWLVMEADETSPGRQRIEKRMEQFGKGANFHPMKFGDTAVEVASNVVWLATHTGMTDGLPKDASLRRACKAYDFHEFHTTFELFFHPSWLEKPRSKPFDSAAFVDDIR